MPESALETVKRLFQFRFDASTEELELATVTADDEALAYYEELLTPDAEIVFATPDGGLVGPMAGPWFGAAGFVAGWREWLGPWEAFTVRITDWVEVGPDRVLLFADATGVMSGSGVEIDTPVGAVYEVANGKITRIEHFLDQDQAKRAAGLD